MTNTSLSTLQQALDNKDWVQVKHYLQATPCNLPTQATSAQLASLLNLSRAIADALIEASSYHMTFDKSFETKRALHQAGACHWALRALRTFSHFQPIVSRLSCILGILGMAGVEGRGIVGAIGAVDEMTVLWHKHQNCVEIVSALVSLCAGHIDNVSRVMRRRGLLVAMNVLRDEQCQDNPSLYEQTLLLVGFCAICIPDTHKEGSQLVPVLTDVLVRVKHSHPPQIVRHALSAVANVCDCWLKERNGYDIPDPDKLVSAIVDNWTALSSSPDVASAASWALVSLMAVRPQARAAVLSNSTAIQSIAERWQRSFSTCRSLLQQIAQITDEPPTSPSDVTAHQIDEASSEAESESFATDPDTTKLSMKTDGLSKETNSLSPTQGADQSRPPSPKKGRARQDDESDLEIPILQRLPKAQRTNPPQSYKIVSGSVIPLQQSQPHARATRCAKVSRSRKRSSYVQDDNLDKESEDVIVISSDSEEEAGPPRKKRYGASLTRKGRCEYEASPVGVWYVENEDVRRSGRKRKMSFKYSTTR